MVPRPTNWLLAALPPAVLEHLTQGLEPVRLEESTILLNNGDPIHHTWFLTSGIVSLLSATENGTTIEAALIGSEGLIGLPEIASANGTPFIAHAQTAGEALRIKSQTLLTLCRQEPALLELLFSYSQTLTAQIAQTMTCHLFHSLEQRLARWLLMARDRTAADTFHLAHEHFARMLGVSRSNISTVTGVLKQKRLVHSERKSITIRDHARLEAAACACYRSISQTINASLPTGGAVKNHNVNH